MDRMFRRERISLNVVVNSGEDGRDLHVLLEGISLSRPVEMTRLEIVTGQRR